MSGIAIAMMAVAITTIWGGLVISVINLIRHPDEQD